MGLSNNLGKLSNMITSTGSAVGIAQASPAYTLDVTGKLSVSNTYLLDPLIRLAATTSGNVEVQIRTATTTYNAGIGVVTSGYDFGFFTNNTTRMTITSAGNVGIGTSTPNLTSVNRTTVDINGPIQSLLSFSSGGTALSYIFNDGYNFTLNTGSGYMNFQVNGSERMRITSGGNVGIGTTSDNYRLEVNANAATWATRIYNASATGSGLVVVTQNTTTSAGLALYNGSSYVLYARNDGNVGIGTSSPSCRLEIAGGYVSLNDNAIRWRFASDANHATVFTATYNGPIMYGYSGAALGYQGTGVIWTNTTSAYNYNNSTTWQQTSDIRIKENIRPITGALSKICSLNPTHFEYKNKLGKTKTGFIAQEFEQVFEGHVIESEPLPEYQEYFAEGEKIKSIDADLIPYLVKAIQELSAQNQDLKSRLDKAGL